MGKRVGVKYFESVFVPRPEEEAVFHQQIRFIRENSEASKFVINYWGLSGIGKTRLLWELHISLSQQNLTSMLFDFNYSENPTLPNLHEINQASFLKIFKQELVSKTIIEDSDKLKTLYLSARYEVLSNELIQEIYRYLRRADRNPLVLFFDSAHVCPPSFIEWLEEQIFSPLIRSKKVLIVFGSRIRQTWRTLDLKVKATEVRLLPFNQLQTRNLLKSYEDDETLTRLLETISFGHPGVITYLLKKLESNPRYQKFLNDNFDKGSAQLLQLQADYMLNQSSTNVDLIEIIRVISPLRWFDYSLLKQILMKFFPEKRVNLRFTDVIDIAQELEATNCFDWTIRHKGFVIDPTLQEILTLDLRVNHTNVFQSVHDLAIEWFGKLAVNDNISFLSDLIYYRSVIGDHEMIEKEAEQIITGFFYRVDLSPINKAMDIERLLRDLNFEINSEHAVPQPYLERLRAKLHDYHNLIQQQTDKMS